VPAGTPAGVVNKLAKDIARVLAAPDLRDWLARHGADPMSMTQPEFARFVLSESESAARIIEAAGIKLNKREVSQYEAPWGTPSPPEVLLLEVGTLQSHFTDCGRMTLADGEAGSYELLPLFATIHRVR